MFDNIGLIGLGPMGRALGQNLIDHGYEINTWEKSPEVRRRVAHMFEPNEISTSLDNIGTSQQLSRLGINSLVNFTPDFLSK